ncbi:zf-HC2 domain-containing protein [Nocardioides sp.]|uniref:anti-sigma factor family protein n=1 Tax=Nocardioides sp. TaxID=35761 RepID=UPI0031FEED3C|nr:putative rane protein [Nocardioides sp.]
MMNSQCQYAHLDGSYVLGALAPAERQEFERHLAGCADCAGAVRELAGLPGLLARVDPDVLTGPPTEVPVPETLLPALVQHVRRNQRRRTLVTAGLAAAVAAIAVGSVTITGVLDGDQAPGASQASPGASATAPVGRTMVAVGQKSVGASLALESVAWGTRLDLVCSYEAGAGWDEPAHAPTYSLVVRTRDGRTQQVATWRALPGRTMTLTAATSASRADIASVEVRTADGHPVLELTT